MKLIGTAFLLVLLSISTNAARTKQYANPCSMRCSHEEDSLFKPGQKYIYSYQGESNIKTTKGLYETTGIMIKSKVTITGLSNCEMKLSMSDVQILDKISKESFQASPNSRKIKQMLELNEVFFTRENEEVKSICIDKDEPIWSENIKKAVIDSLANQGIQTKERTIKRTSHGNCVITSSKESNLPTNEISVNFQYDLRTCENKKMPQSIFTDLSEATVFDVSKVSCQYTYKDKTELRSIQCKEEYRTSKFKQNDNQMVVEITTTLQKENQIKSTDRNFPDKNLIETGIEQAQDEIQSEETTYTSVKQILKEICDQQKSSTPSKIPKLFMTLVNQLKDLSSKEFKEIYLDIMKNDICLGKVSEMRSIFYDASGFVNTPAATSVMVELIRTNQISIFDQNIWLTSLTFMQQIPTIEMLKELETLISVENPSTPMYLGISAVTHLYCKNNFKSCLSDPTVNSIVTKFLQNLNNDCSLPKDISKDHLSKIQISLKALGNLKFYSDKVIQVLNKCISTNTNELSVRISALEVMKHMDCQKDRTMAMNILLNNENDSELRINAYLTVMGCSDINTLFKVREILSKEKVNQVGSFIWTHLTNIKESNDVLKFNIKELLDDVDLKKEFDISKLKFSRNIEKTFRNKQFGMTIDSNVIFSEKSFVPRSVSLNTTALILGRPTNFLEMSARLEGLEDLLFKLFGPDGYMKKKTNVEDNLALINMLNEMSGNMNIKLYGQQISFIELIRGSLSSVKKYNIIEEIMNWSQDKSFEINKNLQLIDKTAVLPTLLGFPLQFKLQGSVSMNIKIKSKLDVSGLLSWPMSFNIDNYISPNINAELNSDIVLQTPFSNYGMRLNIKSGTNTELKAKIFAKNNEEFSLKFDTPKPKQNIISIEGNAYIIHRNNEVIQLQDKLKNYKLCTSEKIVKFFGVKVCGEAKLLDSSIRKDTLLFQPFAANIFIENQDNQSGYILQASAKSSSFISESGRMFTNRNIKFEFNTPNSKNYNRRFYGEMGIDFEDKSMKLEIVTPWNEAKLTTKLKLTESEKKIGFNLQINKKDIVEISAEHLQFSSSKGTTVKGGISVTALDFTPIKTKWNLEITNEQCLLNLFSKGLMKEDTQLKIKILRIKSVRELSLFNKYEISGFYNSYFGNGKILGFASENYYGHRWDIKLSHKNKNSKEFQINFRHKTEDKSSKNLNKYFLTTTFAYGENAENFISIKTENELSEKHIRTSLKASYGQKETKNNKSYKEELSMQLYGGYTWKDDDRHYAEGSLSFKFPTKNLYYEGRYNSEIGKRIFKLSLALDKDQQSKVNLKINYLQPKLYLKDTDFDVTFSLPNHNVDVKWNLREIDVSKYKYTLEGKYNNYDMKVDGVQTQISKLDYDSSLSIKMPRVGGFPKDVKIKLRINLADLSKAKIQGEIEIPNTNYRYSIDSQFSYTPNNLLQISSSEINSVLKYNIELSSRQQTVKSKFIFTCNPEEFQTYFSINFNAKSNSDDQIEFDLHALHKNPITNIFNSIARISIRYPGNSHSIGFKSEFKYTEMVAQIDLTWNKNRRISLTTMYELDNSWTQKGLTASLAIKTPFNGYEQIHFGINAVGQLRYRKVNFECKWATNKKILFDIVLQPRSSSDFSLTSKLVTPFKGMNLITLQAKHIHTLNSINTQCVVEIGPVQRYQIKFEAINNSEGKNRDFMSSILIESGLYPSFKMSVLHKDDSVHYKSQFNALWMKTQSINIKSDVSYTLEDYELITKGNVELFSTMELAKQMKMIWSIENRDSQILNNIQLLHNSKNIFQSSIKGFYENEAEIFKMEFNGVAKLMNGREMKLANNFIYESVIPSIKHRFSISQDANPIYSHNFEGKKKSFTLKMLIPNSEFKTIDIEHNIISNKNSIEGLNFIKIGDKYLFKLEEQIVTERKEGEFEINGKTKFSSDYTPMKDFEIKKEIKYEKNSMKIKFKLTSESVDLMTFATEGLIGNRQTKYKLSITSKYAILRKFNFEFENILKTSDGLCSNNFDLSINDILHIKSKTTIRGLQLIKVDILMKYGEHNKYLNFKHAHHLLGYEHFVDTNIFGEKIEFSNNIISKGEMTLHTKLQGNFWFLRSFEIFGRFSKEKEVKIIYHLPKDFKNNEKIKISFSNLRGFTKFFIEATSSFKAELKFDLQQFKKISFDLKMIPNNKDSTIKLTFNYEGGKNALKHSSELKLTVGDRKFEMKSKAEKVKWNYLLLESEIKTNYNGLNNYKVGLEYKLIPTKYSVNFKTFLNDKFIELSSNLDSSLESKVELKVKTSFAILKEISFELKQKQNSLLTQVTHKCKVIVKTNESLLKFQNEIEWSGINYINIEFSINGKINGEKKKNSYFIQPKSLKFFHQLHKNVLKENLQLILSEETHFKIQLEVPLHSKSKSLLELKSSFQNFKQLSLDFNINFSENEEKSVSLKAKRNNEILFIWESKYKNQNKLILITTDLETTGNYKTALTFEITENNFETKKVKGKFSNSMLKVSIDFTGEVNLPRKELSLSLTGGGDQQLTVYGKISKSNNFLNVKYGSHVFNFEVLIDKNEGIKHIQTTLSSIVNMEFELSRSTKNVKLSGKFEKNYVKLSCDYKGELDVEFNIINVIVAVNMKQIIAIDRMMFKIEGTSNLNGWKQLKTEVEIIRSSSGYTIKAFVIKENEEIMKFNVETKFSGFITLKYSSIYKMIKSGTFELNYENFPNKLIMKFSLENSEKQSIIAEYNLSETSFEGTLKSPFEWFRKVNIQGKLTKSDNEIKGEFQVNHNKLEKPINGNFKLQIKPNIFKIELKTPFSIPYNELSLKREKMNKISIIEIADSQNKLFFYQFKTHSESKFEVSLDVTCPKSLSDITLRFSSNFDFENPTNKIKFLLKSNRFSDVSVDIIYNINQNEYKVKFSHPSKDGQFELKISQYQDSGKQIEILTQFGDMKHDAKIIYKIKNQNDIYFKSIFKCNSHFSSPASFEINYKHKFDIPKNFNLDTQFKFNDKTVFSNSFSWKLQSDNSFDLLGKIILSPYAKEYESKFELSNKRGEIIELIVSATEILKEINIRLVKKKENLELSIKSPFELIKSVNFNIQKELKLNAWTQIVTFDTNTLGKYEMIAEYKMLSNVDVEISIQINTPLANKKLYTQINLKNLDDDQSINGQLELNSQIYQIFLARQNQQIQMKLNTPFDYLKKFEFTMKEKSNLYEVETLYNQHQAKAILSQNQEMVSLTIQTNTEYFKVISVSIERSITDKLDKLIKIKLNMDEKYFKVVCEMNPIRKYFKYSSENNLLNYLPKSFSGLIQYSLTPVDILIELKTNEISFLKIIINKDQFLFNNHIRIHETTITEVKISLTNSKVELILLTNNVFSMLITRTSNNQIDATIMINNNQYSLKSVFENTDNKVIFKLSTYKNAVDKLIEINSEIGKRNEFFDFKIGYLTNSIFKLKLINEQVPTRKISLDIKLFSFNGVADISLERKWSEFNLKTSWNFLYNDQQLHIGSIIYTLKSSRPLNYLITINLQKMSYQAQLMELENGEFRFKISSPYKALDIDTNWLYTQKSDVHAFWFSWKNTLTGEYSMKSQMTFNRDPELKFLFSSTTPIIQYKWGMVTSVVNQVSINTEFRLFDWEKLEFNFKLSTKDLIELIVALRTPFKVAKDVQVKKTIKFISIFEQKYETTISYDGIVKVKYSGGHEIYWSKKIFKFQGRFHNEEKKLISFDIDHSGSHNDLDHSFIWHVKDQKFGFRLNGRFKPMFEGKSEIFTPFHETGKIVLMGKQMEHGIMIEGRNKNERLASFEYLKEKDVQLMKITPPTVYGKPLAIKYSSRRLKRSSGNEIETEVMYGTGKIVDWSSKIEMKNDEYNALISLKIPKISDKTAELSLKHNYKDRTWNFDHQLKIKDSILKVYRLFGNLFRENSKNFKVSLSTEHPIIGQMHISLGHSLTPNKYEHHFLMKSNEKIWMMHNGNIEFDVDRSVFEGNWKTRMDNKHVTVKASHSGNLNNFLQSLLMEYNSIPYLQYKGKLMPNEKSEIEIELPHIGSSRINVILDRKRSQIELLYKTKVDKYIMKMMNKHGKFETSFTFNEKNIALLSIGYATQPLYIKGKYLEHYGNIEMILEKSSLSLKMESTCMRFKRAALKVSTNKIMAEIDYLGKPYTMDAEYEYSPNTINVIINTSIKSISKITLFATPTQMKFTLNEFFQTFNFIVTPHHVKFVSKNNFMAVKTFLIEMLMETPNKAIWKLEINSFTSESKINFSKDKILVQNENNYFTIRSMEFEILSQIERDFKHWTMILLTNKVQTFKLQCQIKDLHYSLGIETYLGQHLIASYNVPSKELIVSLKFQDKFLNLIQKFKEMSNKISKTIIIETTIESSIVYLRKITNEFSYTIDESAYYFKITSGYNNRISVFKGELSKKKLFGHFMMDHSMYSISLTGISADNLNLEVVTPGHQMKMKIENGNNKYLLDIQCDSKQLLNILVKQNPDFKTSFEHESTVEFHGQQVWNLRFTTDFKKYEIKMTSPTKLDVTITNDWREKEMTKLAFLIKYNLNKKPVEIGAGINFLVTSQLSSIEFQAENNFHIIKWMKTVDMTGLKQTTLGLINKNTKNEWKLTVKSIKDKKLELVWKTPTSVREIKYNQIIVNNVRTFIDLDMFGNLKFNLKSDDKTPNLWTGTLSLFSSKMARIEVGKDYVKAIINEDGSENNRIFLKWTISSQGEWKKDYICTKQLTVVQKALNINIDVLQKTRMESLVYSTVTTMKYQLIDGFTKTLELGASLDFSKSNKIVIELLNPFLSIKTILLRSQPDKSTLRYEMESYLNKNKKVNGFFEIKTGSNPGLTTRIYYNTQDESQFLHMHSKYIDDRQMETHIYIEKNQIKTTYFQLLLRLLNEHHVESTFEMKTGILSQISKTINLCRYNLRMKLSELIINEAKWIWKETQNRYHLIINIIPDAKVLQNQLVMFLRQMKIEINSLSKELSEMLKKNEFYFDSMIKNFLKSFPLKSKLLRFVGRIAFYIESTQVRVLRIVNSLIYETLMFYQRLRFITFTFADSIMRPVMDTINYYFSMYFPRFQNYLINRLENIKITFDRKFFKVMSISIQMKKLAKLFILSGTYKMLDKTIEIVKYTLGTIMSGSFDFLKHENEIKMMYINLIKILENLSEKILSKINTLVGQADANLNFLTEDQLFQTLGNSLSSMFGYFIEQLKDENNQRHVRAFIYSSIIYPFGDIRSKIQEFTMDLIWPYYVVLDQRKEQKLYDDEEIKIIVRYTSPIPINDFKSLPDFGYVTRKINKIKSAIEFTKQILKSRYTSGYKYFEMKNWFALYFPRPSFSSILPEFESYATISRRSVLTFDKKSFTLNSDACRVLLSKDIKFNKWEIILNQQKNGQFYTVNIGPDTIELSGSDYRVKLNGKPSELPIQIGSASLVGLGRIMKFKDDNLGLTITIDPLNEMFTVGISGWYHGKVRGLFGNSDNEPFNDFMLANGNIVKSEVFMKSFNYQGHSCSIAEESQASVKSVESCPFLKRLACKFLYKCPFSPLASCFKKVDPTKFHEMCINSNDELLLKLDPSVCNSARQYQAQCHKFGVEIPVPLPCQKCDVSNDKPLSVNEFRNIKVKDKASDIIFIVDEGDCLNPLQDKLPNIVSGLEREMQTKGITSVNYGLVTFVDDYYNKANFHTVGQKLFGSSEEMIKSLRSLKPSNGKYRDLVGAIFMASNYPFREHASRHIIMVSCSSTKEYPVILQTISDRLQQKAIQFSLLTDFSFKLKDDNKKLIIFGVDSKIIYTPLSRNGDKNLVVRPENDFLYKLTMKMKGVVFDYKFMTVNQKLTKEQFVSSLANQISHRATPARSSRCTCIDDGEYNCIPLDTHTIFPVKRAL